MRATPVVAALAASCVCSFQLAAAENRHTESATGAPALPHWTYEGSEGPEAWGDLDPAFASCRTGSQQSPVDVWGAAHDASVAFSYRPTKATVADNGHTIQVDFEPGSFATIDGERFDLLQFHVHTPSEHMLAGNRYPLEVHLVHKNAKGQLAVVGVMYEAGASSATLAPVWKTAPAQAGKVPLKKKLDPAALLPARREAIRYEGSLTTPPCSEGVRWIVMTRPRSEAADLIERFRARFGANARPVQPLGRRVTH